jgi:hypothetical protein
MSRGNNESEPDLMTMPEKERELRREGGADYAITENDIKR